MKIIFIASLVFSTSFSSLAMNVSPLERSVRTVSDCIGLDSRQATYYVSQVCPCCTTDSLYCTLSSFYNFFAVYNNYVNIGINNIVLGSEYLCCCCCKGFFEEFRQGLREEESHRIEAVLRRFNEEASANDENLETECKFSCCCNELFENSGEIEAVLGRANEESNSGMSSIEDNRSDVDEEFKNGKFLVSDESSEIEK